MKDSNRTEMSLPVRMEDLVKYQTGSVVSRTVIDKKAGTVTLFSFDDGEALSEHKAPFDALIYIIDGKAEVTVAGKPMELRSGEAVVIPANKPHSLKAMTAFKMMLIMIHS